MAAIAVFFMLLFFCYMQYRDINDLEQKNKDLTVKVKQAESDVISIKGQYSVINRALNYASDRDNQTEQKTKELQNRLVDAQRGVNAASVPVPDAITQRLRERTLEVNAAATDAGNPVSTVPGSRL